MFAWNARVGNSFDKTLSHPFVAQAGTRSHWKKKNKRGRKKKNNERNEKRKTCLL